MTYKKFITEFEFRLMCYKGFKTFVEFSEEDNLFYGVLLDKDGASLRDLVTWESDDLDGCEKSFRRTVDYYLEFVEKESEEIRNEI